MLKIRPHHILCMRAYQGMGYSKEFSIRMESIIKEIGAYNKYLNSSNLENELKEVEIVFSTDSICEKCPSKLGENLCSTQDKVALLDLKISQYFNIKKGIYKYIELEKLVYNNITEDIFDDICKNCSWYNITNCKSYI